MTHTINISHIHLKVSNLSQSIAFYQNIIGFKVSIQNKQQAVLYIENGKPLITLHEMEHAIPKSRTTGLYHFAILLPTRNDLGMFLLRLISKQYPIDGASDHLVSEALYLQDPDSNGIEVYIDKPQSTWVYQNHQVVMDTLPFPFDEVLATSSNQVLETLPKDTVIGHIHLHVRDLKASSEFYTKRLGFDLMFDAYSAKFLSYDGYHHHIGINVWNGTNATSPKPNQIGLDEVTIVVSDSKVFDQIESNVKELPTYQKLGNQTFEISDPSENRFVFTK